MARRRSKTEERGKAPAFLEFEARHPAVVGAWEALGDATHEAGTLTPRERRLVKLGIAVGARLEGAVRAQARRAGREGIGRDAVDQVAILSITTCGLPAAVAAWSWIEGESKARTRRKASPR